MFTDEPVSDEEVRQLKHLIRDSAEEMLPKLDRGAIEMILHRGPEFKTAIKKIIHEFSVPKEEIREENGNPVVSFP